MKRKTMNPKEYSFNHVKQRLRERYDLDLTEKEYDELNLQARRAKILDIGVEEKKNPQWIFVLKHREVLCNFVYHETKNLITTVLPI